MKRLFAIVISVLAATLAASAQFYSVGNEPPMKWSQITTPGFRVVYPAGLDSLAKE